MSETKIEWCDYTFNPWWGCQRVSPGCEHCYAESFDKRVGGAHWGPGSERRTMSESYWREPLKWNRKAEKEGVRRKVFCASMADVFEAGPVQREARERLGEVIRATPNLDWLLLTKRPENWEAAFIDLGWPGFLGDDRAFMSDTPPNVWVGVTAEDQKRADERIPILLQIPAAVRFVSYEPALEYVDFTSILWPNKGGHRVDVLRGGYWCREGYLGLGPSAELGAPRGGFTNHSDMARIDWVIIGGESGPGARPFNASWASQTLADCEDAGVPCFIKQMGSKPHFDEYTGDPWPIKDPKGGNWQEWPAELRVREFPQERALASNVAP